VVTTQLYIHNTEAACSKGTRAANPTKSNGCAYPACRSDDGSYRCVHSKNFCTLQEVFVTAPQLEVSSGKSCSCQDILDYPNLVGTCTNSGVNTPMVLETDCTGGGEPLCTNSGFNTYLDKIFLTGDDNNPFTACDIKCAYGVGQSLPPPDNTYQQCATPKFEWTAASTSTKGSMVGNYLQVVGDTLYVGGSTLTFDPRPSNVKNFQQTLLDLTLKGPYSASDPTASAMSAVEVLHDIEPYNEYLPYECAVAMFDKNTGAPKKVVSFVGLGTCFVYALASGGPAGAEVIVGAGEDEKDDLSSGNSVMKTEVCTPKPPQDDGSEGAKTECVDGNTILTPDGDADTGYVFYMNQDGTFRWFVQPWPDLDQTKYDAGSRLSDMPALGVSVDDDGDVYVSGRRCFEDSRGKETCSGLLSKLSATDGAVIWEFEFPEADRLMEHVYDSGEKALYISGLIIKTPATKGTLGITCEDAPDGSGCSFLTRISAVDGSVAWTRYAPGTDPREEPSGTLELGYGEVHLAHPDDGNYVYIAYKGVGSLGPTHLHSGTPYSGCKASDGTVTPEFDSVYGGNAVLSQAGCDSANKGTYFSRESEDAMAAITAPTSATCSGYTATHCIAKYHRTTGLPIWGATKPVVYGFSPVSDGILVAGSNYGPAMFDKVRVSGPEGNLSGNDMVWQSKLDLDGKGLYVQSVIADRAWVNGGGMTVDSDGNMFLGMRTTSSKTFLGSGSPNGFTQDLGLAGCDDSDKDCEGREHLVIAKLSTEQTPACIQSCGSGGGKNVIKSGFCYIDQVCYSSGDTAARIGMPCKACNPFKSQTEWGADETTVGSSACLIGGKCVSPGKTDGDLDCRVCVPEKDGNDYTTSDGFVFASDTCQVVTAAPTVTATTAPTKSPTAKAAVDDGKKDSVNTPTTSSAASNNYIAGATISVGVLLFSL